MKSPYVSHQICLSNKISIKSYNIPWNHHIYLFPIKSPWNHIKITEIIIFFPWNPPNVAGLWFNKTALFAPRTMNLLLNDQGFIKLGDFGVSRQMSEHTMLLDASGGIWGNPRWFNGSVNICSFYGDFMGKHMWFEGIWWWCYGISLAK